MHKIFENQFLTSFLGMTIAAIWLELVKYDGKNATTMNNLGKAICFQVLWYQYQLKPLKNIDDVTLTADDSIILIEFWRSK